MSVEDEQILATVAFEADVVFLTSGRPSVSFGRAAECAVRFAHQPVLDVGVPRVAGAIVVLNERIAVDNLSDKVAFDVKSPDGPLETVRPGALLAPASDRVEIIFRGSSSEYLVVVKREAEPTTVVRPPLLGDDPPTGLQPDLTLRQWQILSAYTEPLRKGRTAAATHKDVAAALNWAYATVRVECNAIWGAFKIAGVPLRAFRDKRDAVIDAAIRHRLAPPNPPPAPRERSASEGSD
jgi:hypothetical protein